MQVWDSFLSLLEKDLGLQAIDKWVRSLDVVSFDARNLYLQTDDPLKITWFNEYVRPLLKKGLFNNNGREIRVHLRPKEVKETQSLKTPSFLISSNRLDPELSFEHFVLSEGNKVPYRLLTDDPTPDFNPIYLYGEKHTGKTHLLQAFANKMISEGKKAFYVRAETFTSHVVQAIRLGKMIEFRNIYRNIDVLLVDDIDFLGGKSATQEEFFHTFNALQTVGKQIVISGSKTPPQLSDIEQRLLSRFEWGVTLEVKRGNPKEILSLKAKLWKLDCSNDLLNYLSENFPDDPLVPLQALTLRSKGKELTIDSAKALLKDLIAKQEIGALTFEKILKKVSTHFGVTPEDLLGKSQMRETAYPRQIAMYITREELKLPFQKIGKLFGRDHSTVMTSIKQIKKGIDKIPLKSILYNS